MRTTRQQYLIKQLLHEATSKNLFTQSGQLYQLAKTALQSLNLSEGLADITSLVGLATSMVNLSTDRLYSQTVPITTVPQDPNRVVWAPKAADVWARLQQGQPLVDQLLLNVINEEAAGITVRDEDKQFIAQVYSYMFIGLMLDWIKDDMREDPQQIVEKLSKLIKGSVSVALSRFKL